jgi:hypothetical protein
VRRERKGEEKMILAYWLFFFLVRLIDVCRRSLYLSDANNDLQFDKKKEY